MKRNFEKGKKNISQSDHAIVKWNFEKKTIDNPQCEKVWTNAKRFVVAAACGNKKLILCENLQLLPCVSEIMLKIFMFEINNSVRDWNCKNHRSAYDFLIVLCRTVRPKNESPYGYGAKHNMMCDALKFRSWWSCQELDHSWRHGYFLINAPFLAFHSWSPICKILYNVLQYSCYSIPYDCFQTSIFF